MSGQYPSGGYPSPVGGGGSGVSSGSVGGVHQQSNFNPSQAQMVNNQMRNQMGAQSGVGGNNSLINAGGGGGGGVGNTGQMMLGGVGGGGMMNQQQQQQMNYNQNVMVPQQIQQSITSPASVGMSNLGGGGGGGGQQSVMLGHSIGGSATGGNNLDIHSPSPQQQQQQVQSMPQRSPIMVQQQQHSQGPSPSQQLSMNNVMTVSGVNTSSTSSSGVNSAAAVAAAAAVSAAIGGRSPLQPNTSIPSSTSSTNILPSMLSQQITGSQQQQLPLPQASPGILSVMPQQQQEHQQHHGQHHQHQQQQKDFNIVSLCRFGQETVQDILSRFQDVLSALKLIQPPNGTPTHNPPHEKKITEQFRTIRLLFKRLRLLFDRCISDSFQQGMEYTHIESLIPLKDEPDYKQQEPALSEEYKKSLQENRELVEIVTLRNKQLREIIDRIRIIIWEVNTMLNMRRS